MSRVFFTLAFHHEGPSRRPQFIISTNNLYSVQLKGKNFKDVKIGNPNVDGGFSQRFEYSVSGSKKLTRLSLVMNTSAILPQLTWASPHPSGKGAKPPRAEDDRLVSRRHSRSRSRSNSESDGNRSRRRHRHHRRDTVHDGQEAIGDNGVFDDGGYGGYD